MSGPGKLDRFDPFVPRKPFVNPWDAKGSFHPDYTLLETLLREAVGTAQRAGIVAGAVDVWAAEELRRAGFDPDEVWPRRRAPRVMPRDVRNLVHSGLTTKLREQVEKRYNSSGARKALPAEAYVMGSAYTKQGDVVIASWAAGVELLISTKTILSSYSKNLRNRFEEGYGDAKNLRGRHPLAALGYVFVAGSDISGTELDFTKDMLRKLTTEPDVYDCTCLLVVEGAQGTASDSEEDSDPRDITDEPPGLLTIDEPSPQDYKAENKEDDIGDKGASFIRGTARLVHDNVPAELDAGEFFRVLVEKALRQMPLATYSNVRKRRADAAAKGAV